MSGKKLVTYVINMPQSENRRQYMREKLNAMGIDFSFFVATSGADLPDEYLQQSFTLSQANRGHFGARRAVGEIGCAHSHLNVYRKIAAGDADMALVLEDDIDFSSEFKSIYDYVNANQEKISARFDFIQLGFCNYDGIWDVSSNQFARGKMRVNDRVTIGTPVEFYWSAVGYFITKAGAARLLRLGDPVRMVSDYLLAVSPKFGLKHGIVNIPVVLPSSLNDQSNIEQTAAANEVVSIPGDMHQSSGPPKKLSGAWFYHTIKNRFPSLHRFIGRHINPHWYLTEHGF
jgi:glycosyl transferase family 25